MTGEEFLQNKDIWNHPIVINRNEDDFYEVADLLEEYAEQVSKSVAKQYAEFCVRCDREGLPLLELDDYIKQYCC